jgi:putative transferase (TIGR04331 family)
MGHLNEILLQLKLGQVPIIYRASKSTSQTMDGSLRTWSLEGESRSAFEAFVREMVPKQIPMLYLEGYVGLVKQAQRQSWPKTPKLIWTSNAFSSDEVFKAAIAKMTSAGSSLIIGQHGGHYGIGRWNFQEEHELSIADCYFSWGWTDSKQQHIKPIGKLKPPTFSKRGSSAPVRATLVTAALQRYSGPMISSFMSSQYLDYLQDLFVFVKHLPSTVRQNLIVRLFPCDEGWSQAARWRENFEDIELDSGLLDIGKLMAESKIYICTYNATTYLESLSIGVPTVMFWNPNHWELRDTAIPYFEELKAVGIFHESAASAAQHCARIWDDVESWWQRAEVQYSIQKFCHQYARRPLNLLNMVEANIRDTFSENEKINLR